jgi:RimJ/RimL family protein N-acetyltransferase
MKPKIEAWPDRLSPDAAGAVAKLDRILFEADPPSELDNRWWWVVRNGKGHPIAFAGMRACKHESNSGLALMTRAGVLPSYQGRGIHKSLIKSRVSYAKRKGFKQVVAYVLNKNYASCNALAACGFKLYQPQSDYAGSEAFYYRKVLN